MQTIIWEGDGVAFFNPPVMAHDAGYIMGAVEPRFPMPTQFIPQPQLQYLLLHYALNQVLREVREAINA